MSERRTERSGDIDMDIYVDRDADLDHSMQKVRTSNSPMPSVDDEKENGTILPLLRLIFHRV